MNMQIERDSGFDINQITKLKTLMGFEKKKSKIKMIVEMEC